MAISFDTATDGGATSSGTSLSWSHTCTGSDRYLIVGVLGETTADLVQDVLLNGASMTKLRVATIPSDRYISFWGKLNPPSGSNTIQAAALSPIFMMAAASSYAGVDSLETSASNTATSAASVTGTVTTTAASCWTVAMFAEANTSNTIGAGTGTTIRVNTATFKGLAIGDSNAGVSPGSNTLQGTGDSGKNWATIIASLAPVASALPNRQGGIVTPAGNSAAIARASRF